MDDRHDLSMDGIDDLISCAQQLLTFTAEVRNTVKDEANCFSFAQFIGAGAKILDGIRRGGYVSRISYRQQQAALVGSRLILGEKNREAGRRT